jgi:dihydroorotate dehydrogenase
VRTPYSALFDAALVRVDAERAHHLGFRSLRAVGPITGRSPHLTPGVPVEAMGLRFPNALGLAAGFDKNAVGIDALAALGFGHIEIGTVTGEPQPGNPKPRLFRLPADRAIINRMGFNNDGAEVVAQRLAARAARIARQSPESVTPQSNSVTPRLGRQRLRPVVVGVNIGKTKVVPEEDAIADYRKSANLLAPYADYLVVNVSSPNTPGLRDLQAVEKLEPLLLAVRRAADQATDGKVPLLVKIAPDLSDEDVVAVAELALSVKLDGIIATNTTISRQGLTTPSDAVAALGAGGLSGPPVGARSLAVLEILKARVNDELTLISVGGVTTVADARARIEAGATLVQAYTGFIYEGPLWPRRIADGVSAVQEGVGR